MNRSDLINSLKEKAALSHTDAEKAVCIVFDQIAQTLSKKGRVEIRGFGSFTVKDYKPYVGRNPKTGAKINILPKKLPFFKVGKGLRESVNNHS